MLCSSAIWKNFPNLQRAVVNPAAYSGAAQAEGERMRKQKVLFICIHNSARSQMAAALLNETCGEFFEAESAGLEPGTINPLAVEVLHEVGIDISKNTTQPVFDIWKSGQIFQFVVTVCSEAEAEGCPIFSGVTTRLHWPFEDPSKFTGTHEESLEGTRRVRDQIRAKIDSFCDEHCVASKA
jgi:arsenate reductase